MRGLARWRDGEGLGARPGPVLGCRAEQEERQPRACADSQPGVPQARYAVRGGGLGDPSKAASRASGGTWPDLQPVSGSQWAFGACCLTLVPLNDFKHLHQTEKHPMAHYRPVQSPSMSAAPRWCHWGSGLGVMSWRRFCLPLRTLEAEPRLQPPRSHRQHTRSMASWAHPSTSNSGRQAGWQP